MKKNKKPYKLLALALALTFSSSSVHALVINATVSGGTTLLSSGTTATDSTTTSGSVSTNSSTNPSISQFNSSLGVLTGVTATMTAGDSTTYLRADGRDRASGTASVNTTWNGVSGLNVSGSLNTATKSGNIDGADNTWNPPLSQTVTNSMNLDSWVGTGSLNTSVTTTLTANRSANNDGSSGAAQITAGISSSNSNVTGNGSATPSPAALTATYEVTYSYLEHAAPSFDGGLSQTVLNLNFNDVFGDPSGNIYVGDAIGSLAFSLFNLTGDRVGLDLDFITSSGDISILSTDLALFSNLAAGNSQGFFAFLDTANAGTFSATYRLSLSDADVGASSSRYAFNDYLTLNLTGNVLARASSAAQVNDVPEPGLLALMSIGLFSFLGLARRKRNLSI